MSRRRNPESGFALLFIYAMAATIAIMLYMELPRVAFEAQRDKEQLLIDRGEQYSRAVTLYVRKFNRYPADFDALQSTQNLRFLRHKYVDPMTGKDDWRIIHVGPGGVFTDSVVYGKKKDGKQATEQQNFITEMQQTGGNQTGGAGQQGVNIGTRQRPSDQPGAPGDPGAAQNPGAPQNPGEPQNPAAPPNGIQPLDPNATGVNGPMQVLPDGRVVPVFQPQAPGDPNQIPGFNRGLNPVNPVAPPNQPFPNNVPQPSGFPQQNNFPQPNGLPQPNPFPQQNNFPQPNGFPQQNNFPQPSGFPQQNNFPQPNGFPQQGQQGGFQPPTGQPAGAANLINQLLTTPRPGGLNGLGQQPAGANTNPGGINPGGINPGGITSAAPASNTGTPTAPMAGQTIGGGIAGVASKLEQDGIKVYKERTPYNEWEFVYDITKDTSRGGAAAQPQPQQQQPGQQPAPQQPQQPPPAPPQQPAK